jgi:hypothetical protein
MKTIDRYGNEVIPEVKMFDAEGNEVHEGETAGPGWFLLEIPGETLDEIKLDESIIVEHAIYTPPKKKVN